MNDPMIFLFVAITGASFGFLVGFMVRALTRGGEENKKSVDAELAMELLQQEAAQPKKAPNKNWMEAATLWRDRKDGKFIFQIEDQYYKQGNDLKPKEREILLKVVMNFHRWLEPSADLTPKPAKTEAVPASTVVESVPVSAYQNGNGNGITPPTRGDYNPVSMFAKALEADVPVKASAPQSMVAQVDAILQEKIIAADMQKWAIRLTEFPSRGMVVLVGLEQYDGIDQVPYERVRKIIRASVAEWERRAEAGELLAS